MLVMVKSIFPSTRFYISFSLLFFISSAVALPYYPAFSRLQNSVKGFNHRGRQLISYNWTAGYFTQTLDHFSFTEKSYSTFQQKYLIYDEYWSGADVYGPIFVYCGNEGSIEWFANNAGFIREIAPEFGALVVAIEHRYYGESMPFGSTEAAFNNSESLAYLTTEQAIADYAIFLTSLKSNLSAELSPVVLFGGSYGGMIAAWFRLKYPHIAIGALASSAPILQFEDTVPDDIFYKIVSADFWMESVDCFNTIRNSWSVLNELGSTAEGLKNLTSTFRMCNYLSDIADLKAWLYDGFSYLAMVDYPIATDFLMPLPAFPVREACRRLDALPAETDILTKLFTAISVYYNYTGEYSCFDIESDPYGFQGWDYQACTEMVMPMSSNPNNSMFESFDFNLTLYDQHCFQTYGIHPRPNWIMTQYGGKNIKNVLKSFASNIIFSNGALDPWSGGGVLENISSTIISLIIPDGAHHLDLRASTLMDPPSVIAQRNAEKKIINQWIQQYFSENNLYNAKFSSKLESVINFFKGLVPSFFSHKFASTSF